MRRSFPYVQCQRVRQTRPATIAMLLWYSHFEPAAAVCAASSGGCLTTSVRGAAPKLARRPGRCGCTNANREVAMRSRNHLRLAVATALVVVAQGCVDAATGPDARIPPAAEAGRNPFALQPVDLGTLGGPSVGRSSEAHAINPAGDIVGWGTPTG